MIPISSTFQSGPATFQVLSSHMQLVATALVIAFLGD